MISAEAHMKIVVLSRAPGWYPWKHDNYMSHLSRAGHQILAVVVERVSTPRFLRELAQSYGWRTFAQKMLSRFRRASRRSASVSSDRELHSSAGAGLRPRVVTVPSHRDASCVAIVRALGPDILVLRGAGIVRKALLDVPRYGSLNAHYGLLPEFRGMHVIEWSVLRGTPVGVTVHLVDEGIDTGAILMVQEVEPRPGDTFESLLDHLGTIAAGMLARAATGLEDGTLHPRVQLAEAGRQYFSMHPRLRTLAEACLRARTDNAT